MTTASLSKIPATEDEMQAWSFCHIAHHRDINRLIHEKTGSLLPEYAVDITGFVAPEDVLELHQTMHNNQNQVLGIAGADLSEVDFSDIGQRANWIFLNHQDHYAANQKLGI